MKYLTHPNLCLTHQIWYLLVQLDRSLFITAGTFFWNPRGLQLLAGRGFCFQQGLCKVCESWGLIAKYLKIRLMEENPNNHLGCIRPCKWQQGKLPMNWCRISSITSITIWFWNCRINVSICIQIQYNTFHELIQIYILHGLLTPGTDFDLVAITALLLRSSHRNGRAPFETDLASLLLARGKVSSYHYLSWQPMTRLASESNPWSNLEHGKYSKIHGKIRCFGQICVFSPPSPRSFLSNVVLFHPLSLCRQETDPHICGNYMEEQKGGNRLRLHNTLMSTHHGQHQRCNPSMRCPLYLRRWDLETSKWT